MRNIYIASILSVAFLGCSESDRPPPGKSNIDGGFNPVVDAGNAPDSGLDLPDAAMNSQGPLVTVLSPMAATSADLSANAIVTTDRITVLCSAATNPATGDSVDASTVRFSITGGNSLLELPATPTGAADQYQASISLGEFPNGELSIVCTAADSSGEARGNSDIVKTYLDLGPQVDVLSPLANTSLANQTDIVFSVQGSPVVPSGDTAADPVLANAEVSIAGVVIPKVSEVNGTFTVTVDFNGPLFTPSLVGQQTLRVTAPNMRGVSREIDVLFTVDNEGPVIEIVTPTIGELVSGVISIQANVTDSAGIQSQSVVATIVGTNEVTLVAGAGDLYTGVFDTRILGPLVFPNIIVRALDNTGNQSSTGYLIGLDNAAPIATLDSPNLREAQLTDGVLNCSRSFDPLGSDSVNDGQGVYQLFEVRARLEDLSNNATLTSGIVVPRAFVDVDSVELFLLDDQNAALIVDTDGDGFCDDINPLLVPTSVPTANNEVAVIAMAPVASSGSSFFGTDTAPTFADTSNGACTATDEAIPPDPACASTPLTRIIKLPIAAINPIYGIPPFNELQCMGNAVDALATNLADGWACLGVRGSDNLGNQNISPPLRICIDSDANGADGCPAVNTINLSGAPNCTGTYDPVTNTVDTQTPCTIELTFDANELRRIDL